MSTALDILTKRQIRRVCLDNDFDYRITKVPARRCNVDLRIARYPRYSRGNCIEVRWMHSPGKEWHFLGWLWNLEACTGYQITRRLDEIVIRLYERRGAS